MKIYKKIDDLVGKTPLFEIANIEKELNLKAKVLIKLECFNPAGSIKDRAALEMINDAEEKGLIKSGATIIEPTSGNTGIGLAAIGVSRGYRVILTMPETMSVERRKLLKAYGAEVVLTEGSLGMKGAILKAEELHKEIKGSFIPLQFSNLANPLAHYKTTGKEIYEDTDGKVEILVAGVGTGGTLSGAGKYLKEKIKDITVVAVEPENSQMLGKGVSGSHKIQGIGANFVPQNFDKTVCDKIFPVSDFDAIECAKNLAKKEGLLTGISSGAALFCAIELAKDKSNEGKIIVAIMPDTGERYLSTELFSE